MIQMWQIYANRTDGRTNQSRVDKHISGWLSKYLPSQISSLMGHSKEEDFLELLDEVKDKILNFFVESKPRLRH